MNIYKFIFVVTLISPLLYSQPQWTQLNSGTSAILTNLCFVSNNVGWAVGYDGEILKTTNGGITWNQQTSNTNTNLFSVFFIDNQRGWIGGAGGLLLTTTNGGNNWNTSSIGSGNEVVYSIDFSDEQTGYALVSQLTPYYYGYIKKTSDSGSSWQTKYTINGAAFLTVRAMQEYCWAVGTSVAAYSTDYGNTWYVDSPTSYWLLGVYFLKHQLGWAVGGIDNGNNVEIIMKTIDGGITWQTVEENYNFKSLKGVYFVNADTGWAVGSNGRILNTTDGGSTWIVQNSPVSNNLRKIQFPSESTGYIVGEGGVILKYSAFTPITVLDPNGGESIAAGSNYYVQWSSTDVANVKLDYSIDDGTNWINIVDSIPSTGIYNWTVPNTLTSEGRVRISDVSDSTTFDISDGPFTIQSSHIITVTAPNGGEEIQGNSTYEINWTSNDVQNVKIEYSINNGATWDSVADSVESSGAYQWNVPNVLTTQGRIKISDLALPSVYDASDAPFRIDYISNVNDQTGVSKYQLLQNYPNPFNPTTTIKYSIKNSGLVSLKVYDILGHEVATLVDQNQQIGNYDVSFDASRLASGIYYYRLKSGTFIQTKKLILLK